MYQLYQNWVSVAIEQRPIETLRNNSHANSRNKTDKGKRQHCSFGFLSNLTGFHGISSNQETL